MRSDIHGTISLHYFHSYAIADRIDFSNLSEESGHSFDLGNDALAFMLLPSLEDEEALRKNFKILIARCLYDNIPFFKTTFDGVLNWHIRHCYSDQMSKKSITVSPFMYASMCYAMMPL
jgi:L1 cell adhesion molecule like protein